MICKKCKQEIEDLSMYCPRCGAPQFSNENKTIDLYLADPEQSKVIIQSVDNLTTAFTAIQRITGLKVVEIRELLKEVPCCLMENLTKEEAERTVEMLKEYGLDAIAKHPEKKEEVQAQPIQQDNNEEKEHKKEDEIELVIHPTPESDKEFMLELAEYMNEKDAK